jgi:hypothetical protein
MVHFRFHKIPQLVPILSHTCTPNSPKIHSNIILPCTPKSSLRVFQPKFCTHSVSGIFLFTTASRTALEPTQPPIQQVLGDPSLGVKWPGREVDHSPPSSAEVKNEWSCTSTPPYAFMAWCLVKHRDNFIFTFTFNHACYTASPISSCLTWSP